MNPVSHPLSGRLLLGYLAVFVFYFISYVLIGVLPFRAKDLGADEADLGLLMAAAGLASMMARPLVGTAVDRWGTAAIIRVAGLGYFVSLFGYLVPNLYVVGAMRLVHGAISASLSTAVAVSLMSMLAASARATGMTCYGLATIVPTLGVSAAMPLLATLGFDDLVLSLSAAGGITAFLAVAYTRAVEQPQTVQVNQWNDVPSDSPVVSRVVAAAAAIIFLNAAYNSIISFLSLSLPGRESEASAFFFVQSLTIIGGRFAAGRFLPSNGRPPLLLVPLMLVAAAVGMAILARADRTLDHLVAAVLTGVPVGVTFPALLTLVSFAPPKCRGIAVGCFLSAADLGFMTGAAGLGLLATSYGFSIMFATAGLGCLAGAVLFVAAARR